MKSFVFHNADEEIISYTGMPSEWRVSAYAFIIRDDTLLLIKKADEKLFDIPGGGIEMGEKIAEGLKREAIEEAGADIEIGDFISMNEDFFYHRGKNAYYQTLQLFYRAKLVGTLRKPTEPLMVSAEFVRFSDLTKYPLPTAVHTALKKIF